MCHWHHQLDMSRTLAAYLLLRHLNTAPVADDALIAYALVLTAGTLVVLGWTEDVLAEQTITLWLVGTVVDGFWLCYLAKRIFLYLLW